MISNVIQFSNLLRIVIFYSDLGLLYDWFKATSLTFNSNKSCVVSYHLPRSVPIIFDYFLDGQCIDHARPSKDVMFDFQLDYISRLTALKLLPLMYRFEYIEVVFFFVQLQHCDSHFDILNFFSFSSSFIRSSSHNKLVHSSLTRFSADICFSTASLVCGTHYLQSISHYQSLTSKKTVTKKINILLINCWF